MTGFYTLGETLRSMPQARLNSVMQGINRGVTANSPKQHEAQPLGVVTVNPQKLCWKIIRRL